MLKIEMRRYPALARATLILSSQAQAVPVTYSCKLVDGRRDIGMYAGVDQVVVYTEHPLIDLRVARTMCTST